MAARTYRSSRAYLDAMRDLLSRLDTRSIDKFADVLFQAWRDDRLVVAFGNGGSAATASHLVADLVKTAAVDGRRRLRAICLTDNACLTTAVGNDIDYGQTFCYALETYARPRDLAVAISVSGNSPNVVHACRWALEHDVTVVALTGFDGGALSRLSDTNVHISCDNYGLVEDLHLAVGHIVAQSLKVRMTDEWGAA